LRKQEGIEIKACAKSLFSELISAADCGAFGSGVFAIGFNADTEVLIIAGAHFEERPTAPSVGLPPEFLPDTVSHPLRRSITMIENPPEPAEKPFFESHRRVRWTDLRRALQRPFVWSLLVVPVLTIIGVCLHNKKLDLAVSASVSLVIGIVGSVIAAQIYASLDERIARKQLERLLALAPKAYLDAWASEMQDFGGFYCSDYRIRIKLIPQQEGARLFICQIRYEYVREGLSGERHFTFRRSRLGRKVPEPAHTPAYVRDIFDWENDERSMQTDGDIADLYNVTGVTVENQPLTVRRTAGEDQIVFTAQLPDSGKRRVRIEFTVAFPIEHESILTVYAEFPTSSMSVEFDWDAVGTLIEQPHAQLHFTNQTKVNQTTHGERTLKWTHDGWVTPKNGVTFVWWQR
jgi:hypothetical protein